MLWRFFKNGALTLTAFAAILFTSCNKDGQSYRYETNYGNVVMDGERYDIRTDEGVLLTVAENFAYAEVADGERVLVHYAILDETADGYLIRLNILESILTKKPLFPSSLTPEELDELGDDFVNMQHIWAAGRYVTLYVEFLRNDPEARHFVNLLVDEERSTDQDVYLAFRHNAYGDEPRLPIIGRVSFDLTDLIPEGQEEITVYLSWTNYQQADRTHSFTFKRPATESAGSEILPHNQGANLTIY